MEVINLNDKIKGIICSILSICLMFNGLFVENILGAGENAPMKKAKRPVTLNLGKEERFKFH